MQFERRFADAIKSGDVTLTFRRWARPQAVVGHRYRVPQIGFVDVTRVDEIDASAITLRDAKRAGFATLQALRDYMQVKARAAGTLYRIELRYAGVGAPDPRAELAHRAAGEEELEPTGRATGFDGPQIDERCVDAALPVIDRNVRPARAPAISPCASAGTHRRSKRTCAA